MRFWILTLAFVPTLSFSQVETLDTIEVRGNKDNKTFVESNESISVLKEKNLNRGDLQNSVQMLNGFANVQTQTDKNGDTFSIRGISDMGVTGYQKDNLASILVDDVFQTTLAVRAGSFENWDLEAVEIRRGAQSTDQGVNSLAGNILLYHKAPSATDEAVAKVGLGSFGRREAGVVLNKAISSKFAVRMSYNKEDQDGFIKNSTTGNDKWNERKKDHFVTDLAYKLSDSESLRLNMKVLRMHKGGSYAQDAKKYKVYEDQDFKEIINNQQAGLTYNKRFSESVSNKIILGASQSQSSEKSDEDGTAVNLAGTERDTGKDQFLSFENQLKYQSDKIKNVLGVHFHHYYLNNIYRMNLMFAANQIYPVVQEDTKYRDTYALFNSFNYDFDSHHSLNLAGRVEMVKNKFGNDISILSASPYAALTGDHEDTSTNSVFLPKIGYTYKNQNYSLGTSYSQGYRTGGVSVNRWKATTHDYQPEKTHNYELSYKYLKERFVLAANTFYTKWNDQQVEVAFSNSFDTQVQNASTSELYGAEVESSYRLQNQDSIRLNVGYVHTQFLSFNNNGKSFGGNDFPNASPLTGQASYWKSISDSWMLIFISRYISESWTDPNNTRWSPEQFYFDTNLQYVQEQYMVEFYTRNILDQKYRIFNGAPRTTTTPYLASYHRVSSPREFGARLNYYW